MQTAMRASTVGRARRRPKTYAEGRVCSDDACTVRLSRYNRAEFCFNHAPARFPRLRGEFTAEYLAKQNS
ncbi:MAG: hypothetical protein R3290_03200 [Acidimicrobiia bacterium]|nr:hypothetical protein [Acidimicrobiia bacterium]